jgi:ATP-dependent Clp protease ATP-binding subunit ClpC
VVLFDEIEKAHTDVFNMLLQIMEEGRLTDSFGRNVDFKNTILIMTSNIGAEVIKNQSSLGFRRTNVDAGYEAMKSQLLQEVEKHFRPEFLNRIDDVIVFRALTREDLNQIILIEMQGIEGRMAERNITLELTPEAKDFLIEKGYNPEYGARPLRRALEHNVEDTLSESILRGEFHEANHIIIRIRDNHLYFDAVKRPPGTPAVPPQAIGQGSGPGAGGAPGGSPGGKVGSN